MRKAAAVLVLVLAVPFASQAGSSNPFQQDPLGPISDVTLDWLDYQPATEFCIRPDVFDITFDTGLNATGDDCADSGFPAGTEQVYYRLNIQAPALCPGCRRIFIDFSKIPAVNSPPLYYARGHAYFRFDSMNGNYIADPKAHSPNMKNFTNDKLFVPDGSMQEGFVAAFDFHSMAYTSDTAHFAHTASQGPWYAGPWYINTAGQRINGVYLDIDVNNCGSASCSTGNPNLDAIGYRAGFNAGEPTCPDNVLLDGAYADGNYFYGGCADRFGFSSQGVDPYP